MPRFENVLVNKMTLGRKVDALETYLKHSERTVTVDGITYGWVERLITDDYADAKGERVTLGLDGLVLVMRRYGGDRDGEPYYVGTGTPSEQAALLTRLASSLTEEQLLDITSANALRSMAKRR